jgi:4-hydroxybenzoate polyprenyltransferase
MRKVLIAMGDIKLAHSVFAMPFAILGVFLVAPRTDDQIAWGTIGKLLVLVVVCMVFARNWAMLFNRVADARIDAANPRTSRRAFASGALSARDGYLMLGLNAIGFMIACSLFGFIFGNWWPGILGVPVLAWIAFYSLTKRFTWLCHVFLGGALAASPIAAAIATNPELLSATPSVFWIAGMVLCWVAGFDVIYALQDLEYDRSVGLSSMPARFGWKKALWVSRVLHLVAIGCLFGAFVSSDQLGMVFAIAIGITAALLVWEHTLLIRRGKAGIPMAFFTLNGIVSIVLGVAGCIEIGLL